MDWINYDDQEWINNGCPKRPSYGWFSLALYHYEHLQRHKANRKRSTDNQDK